MKNPNQDNTRMYRPEQVAEDLKYTDFNQWIADRPTEELAYFLAVNEQCESMFNEQDPAEQARKRQEVDDDTYLRLGMVALHFTDKVQWEQRHLDSAFNKLMSHIGMELGVRQGVLVKEGVSALLPGEDTARFVFVDKEPNQQ